MNLRQNAIIIQPIAQKGDVLTPFYYLSNFSHIEVVSPISSIFR
jgi:hypothetical protein